MTYYEITIPKYKQDSFVTQVKEDVWSIQLCSKAELLEWIGINESQQILISNNLVAFAINGDGNATSVNIIAMKILDFKLYAIFDKVLPKDSWIRINYCLMYFG